jgi:hypothetical protein
MPAWEIGRTSEEGLGLPLLDDAALVHEYDAVGDLPREAHLVRDHYHGHPVAREADHDVQDLGDHLRIERGGGLVNSMIRGCMASARAIATRCWPPEAGSGSVRLPGMPTREPGPSRASTRRAAPSMTGARAMFWARSCANRVQRLKHCADLSPEPAQVGVRRPTPPV